MNASAIQSPQTLIEGTPTDTRSSQAAAKMVQDFEAILLRQMLKQMRQFSWSSSASGGDGHQSMADEALAGHLAASDALGLQKTLAPTLLRQMAWQDAAKQTTQNRRLP